MNPYPYWRLFSLTIFIWLSARVGHGQVPTAPTDSATDGWGKVSSSPSVGRSRKLRRHQTGFGLSKQLQDSLQRAFGAHHGMRHRFGKFYSDSTNNWAVLSTTFGEREGEGRFILIACPAFDFASFRNDFPFWHDRYRVAYACLACYRQEVYLMPSADPATFRSLGMENLAVDRRHVYQINAVVPALLPATLQVYTRNGERYFHPDGVSDSYLISGRVGYPPFGKRMTEAQAIHFRPPAPYRLAYPLPAQPPAKIRVRRTTKH